MNLANTIKAMYEKRNSPPWDNSEQDYAGAAKELHDYAMKNGGVDKADFLKVANQLKALAKQKSPSVGARMMRDVQALDTDVREKVYSVLKKHGLKEELSSDLEVIEEAMVRGKEVFDKTFANRKQAVAFADKNGGYVKQVGRVFYVFKGEPVKEAEGDKEENEPCPECGEYPCECDDVKTTESSCGSKKMKEEVELDENKNLIKDYQDMKAQGKKDHNILDVLMSMPKYKRMSKDQMAKIIGDAKRKGIFKEEVELDEAYKTPAEASAYEAGKKAVAKGVSYDDNPNKKGSKEYTAWSKGHNDARARKIARKEEVEFDVDALFEETIEEAKSKEQQIADLEKMLDRISGNTSSVKMKKFALQKKIDKLKNEELEEEVELDEGILDKIKKIVKFTVNVPLLVRLVSAVEKGDLGAVNSGINTLLDKMKLSGKEREKKKNEIYKTLAKSTKNRDMSVILDKMGSVNEEVELEEAKRDPSKSGGSGYDLYHKDFSSAMKHAYDYAKKKFGITIDPKEIDDKVASGPRKPSAGKTNSYRLKGDKGSVQIQVANLDNKKYELNMYKEEVELEETAMDLEQAIKAVVFGLEEKKAPVTKKDDDGDGMDPVGQEDGDVDNDGDKDSSDDYLKNRRKAVGKAIKKDKKKDGEGATTGSQDSVDTKPSVEEETEMSDAEKAKMEKIKAKLDAKKGEFEKKYGDRAKEVIARTAIKMAKNQMSEEISPEIMRIVQKYGASDEVSRLKRYSRETRGLTPDQIRDKNSIIARAKSKAK